MTMRELILLPCVVLLTAAAPATNQQATTNQIVSSDSQQGATASGDSGAAQAPLPEKKICKQLPTSGSRLPNRACLTADQWKQVEEDLSH
jgi:hypothetical protein